MKIEVVGCRLLIRPFKLQDHDQVYARAHKAGIALPELTKRKEEINVDKGTVLMIGEQAHQDYVGHLKVGDVIGYAKFGGKFFPDPNNPDDLYLVINDEDVICVFKE
jgi:co-chaperonin GroES (HSP10)